MRRKKWYTSGLPAAWVDQALQLAQTPLIVRHERSATYEWHNPYIRIRIIGDGMSHPPWTLLYLVHSQASECISTLMMTSDRNSLMVRDL